MKRHSLVILGLGLLLSFFLPGLAFLIFIFFISQLLTKTFSKLNFILCIFFSILFTGAILAILTYFIDAITPYTNEFIIVNILFSLFNVAYVFSTRGRIVKYNFDNIGVSLVSVSVSIGAIIFLLFPLLQIKNASQMIYFLTTGEDNASHFALFDHDLTNKSVTYFDQKPTGVITSLDTYPQGIHVFAAFSYWSFMGDKYHSTYTLLRMYYLSLVLCCASLTFILAEIIGRLVKNRFKYIAVVIGSVILFTASIIYLAGWGFITQIFALVYLFALLYILALIKQKADNNRGLYAFELVVYGMLSVGIAFSWYLLLFVAVVILFTKLRTALRNKFIRYTTVFPLVLFIAAPIILSVTRGRATSSLNQPGGVYIYGPYAMLFILASIIILGITLLDIRKHNLVVNRPIILFIVSSYIMSILIAAYQLFDGGTLQYYFYKTIYSLFIIATITIVVYFANHLGKIRKIKTTIVVYIAISVGFIVSYSLINPTYPRVYVNDWFYHYITPDTLDKAIALRDNKKITTQDVLYQYKCSYLGEYLSNRWTGAIFQSDNTDRSTFTNGVLAKKTGIEVNSKYIQSHPNTVVIDQPCN